MKASEFVSVNTAGKVDVSGAGWTQAKYFRFHVLITKEDDGALSVIALNLPGVGSMGDTEEEALANFREAAKGVLESYTESGEKIPWKPSCGSDDIPVGATYKWIIVNV